LKKDKSNDKKQIIEYMKQLLLMFLYTHQAPRRNNDYRQMRFLKLKEYEKLEDYDDNYLIYDLKKENFTFSFYHYKTSSIYGNQKIKVNDDNENLKYLLKTYIKYKLKYTDNDILFSNNQNNMYSSSKFTEFFKLAFKDSGKNLTSTMLRKIYISDNFSIGMVKMFYKSAKKTSEAMGHSLKTQQEVYFKD